MKSKIFIFFQILFVLTFLIGCANPQPIQIEVGKINCAHCSMSIVDKRFHTQLISTKGRRFHFDSIECYYHFREVNSTQIQKVWLSNYQNQNEFLEESIAFIAQSKNIRSPMGEGFAAFKSKDEYEQNFK